MKIRLLSVGKGAPSWADDACRDYSKRMRRFGGVEEVLIRPEKFRGDVDAVRLAESRRVLAQVKPRDRLVVLDERGEAPTTHEFLALVEEGLRAEGALVFCMGGPYGHDAATRRAAWKTMRLSNMVLNHQVARVVWFEALYRAMTIKHGVPYHH